MATVTSDIGGGANDYATITAWELATRGSSDLQVGIIYEKVGGYVESVDVQGGGSGGRRLEVATGDFYNPLTGDGVIWAAGTGDRYVLRIGESNFQVFGGIFFASLYNGSQNNQVIRIGSGAAISGVEVRGAYCRMLNSNTGGLKRGIYISSDSTGARVYSSIVLGGGPPIASQVGGMNYGIEDDGASTEVYNCLVIGVNDTISGNVGVKMDVASGTVRNCGVYESGSTDFTFAAGVTHTHNASSDATATGTGSFINRLVATDVEDANAGNLLPKRGGILIDSGVAVTGADRDYIGVSHNGDGGGREIGAFNINTRVPVQANLESQTAMAGTFGLAKRLQVTMPAQTAMAGTIGLAKRLQATLPAETSLAAQVGVGKRVRANLDAETALQAQLKLAKRIQAQLDAEAALVATVGIARVGALLRVQAALESATAIVARVSVLKPIPDALYMPAAEARIAGGEVAQAASAGVAAWQVGSAGGEAVEAGLVELSAAQGGGGGAAR